jgi:hypothetical protein
MKTRRECAECWAPFEGEHWQRLCWTCWRERRDGEARTDHGHTVRVEPLLDEPTLKAAIRLTHPDAQPVERRELATSTTAKLLDALATVRSIERRAA